MSALDVPPKEFSLVEKLSKIAIFAKLFKALKIDSKKLNGSSH